MNGTKLDRSLAALVLTLVVADWATKIWLIGTLPLGESRTIIEGWLYFLHRQNPGVAFSLFADMPGSWRFPLLMVFSLIGIVLFTRIVLTTDDRLTRITASSVVAGAIGNFGDRMITGEVTDFIYVAFFPFVFNVADAAITVGGAILAVRLATLKEPDAAGGMLEEGVG